jgi:hypothetical protein
MGVDAGAAGAFGLYLPQFDQLEDLYKNLQGYVKLVRDSESEEAPDSEPHHLDQIPTYRDRFVEAFAEKYKIIVPPGAYLLWTGNEDDRPARCDTPSEQWVLGWGLLTKPWDYPEMDASFRKHASFHEWVWMG